MSNLPKDQAKLGPPAAGSLCEVCGRIKALSADGCEVPGTQIGEICFSGVGSFGVGFVDASCWAKGYQREKARAATAYAALDRLESILRGLAVSAVNGDYTADVVAMRLIAEADNAEHVLDGLDQGTATPQEAPSEFSPVAQQDSVSALTGKEGLEAPPREAPEPGGTLTEQEVEELRAEASAKYDHPTKPTPMPMNPRGVLLLIERGDGDRRDAGALTDLLREAREVEQELAPLANAIYDQCDALIAPATRSALFESVQRLANKLLFAAEAASEQPRRATEDPSDSAPLEGLKDLERAAVPRPPRSARFTVLADSEDEKEQDYIVLDVPIAQAEQIFEKVRLMRECAQDPDMDPKSLICVYLEVEPHRQSYVGFDKADKEIETTYPASLLRDDIDPAPQAPSASAVPATQMEAAPQGPVHVWVIGEADHRRRTLCGKPAVRGMVGCDIRVEDDWLMVTCDECDRERAAPAAPLLCGEGIYETAAAAAGMPEPQEAPPAVPATDQMGAASADAQQEGNAVVVRRSDGAPLPTAGNPASPFFTSDPPTAGPLAVLALPSGARRETTQRAANAASPSLSAAERAWAAYQDCDHDPEFHACQDCIGQAIRAAEAARDARWREALTLALGEAWIAVLLRSRDPLHTTLRRLLGSVATKPTAPSSASGALAGSEEPTPKEKK